VRSPPGAVARIALASAVACAWLATTSRARAATLSAELTVERAAGADDCPDGDGLSRIIERIVRADVASPIVRLGGDVRAAVRFSRGATTYQATLLLAGQREGERTLTDTGPTCTALGRAVGITMALLLDAGLEARAEPAPPVTVSALAAAPATPAPRATDGTLAVTVGPALGLVGGPSVATGLAFLVAWRHRVALGLDGQYVAPRANALDTGEVDVALLAARLRLCGVLGGRARLRVGVCAVGAAGQLRGEGHGYPTADGAAALTWLAAGGGLDATWAPAGRWRVGVAADALAPLRKSTFSVMNRGIAYQSSPVSVMLAVSVGVAIW
jgi:hypothetical protein